MRLKDFVNAVREYRPNDMPGIDGMSDNQIIRELRKCGHCDQLHCTTDEVLDAIHQATSLTHFRDILQQAILAK